MKPSEARAARKANVEADTFDADARTERRERTPVKIAGATFTRRRKDWAVSRLMRQTMRDQEKALALSNRIKSRIAELEAKQAEAASDDDEAEEESIEVRIDDLVKRSDDALESAELCTYRLLALLLIPPSEGYGETNRPLVGFGPDAAEDNEGDVEEALEFLQPALDVEDAAELARELTGSREPDPTTTPSSGTGSS
jgi:hypothetical protein